MPCAAGFAAEGSRFQPKTERRTNKKSIRVLAATLFLAYGDMKKMESHAPAKGKLYKGTEPHGALLTTYVNNPALAAIKGKKGTMPAGAIVVKENYMPDKKLAAITVMYKVAGYNPEGGDWFWAKYTPDGKVEAEGKSGMADMCIGCHGKAKGNDFLYTGELK